MVTRLTGAKLAIQIGDTEYKDNVTSWSFGNEDADSDVLTFADAEAGDIKDWTLTTGIVQSTDPDSLHMHVWDHEGESFTYVVAPHGNEIPSPAQPHFVGSGTMPTPPETGGEAGRRNTFTTEVTFELDGKPRKITSAE